MYYILYYKSDNPATKQKARDDVFRNSQRNGLYVIYIRSLATLPQCLKDLHIGDVTSGGLPGLFAIAKGAPKSLDELEATISPFVFFENLDLDCAELTEFFNKHCKVTKITLFSRDGQPYQKTIVKRKRVEEYTPDQKYVAISQVTRETIQELQALDKMISELLQEQTESFVDFSTAEQKELIEKLNRWWADILRNQQRNMGEMGEAIKETCLWQTNEFIQTCERKLRGAAFDAAQVATSLKRKRFHRLETDEENAEHYLMMLKDYIKKAERETNVRLYFVNSHDFLSYWELDKIERYQYTAPKPKPKVVVMMPPKK